MEILKTFSVDMLLFLYFAVISSCLAAAVPTAGSVCEDTVPDCRTYSRDDICTGVSKMYGAVHCRKTCGHCNDCNSGFYHENGLCRACNYWCNVNDSSTLSVCRENDGFCEFGCKVGRYGYKCDLRCSATCKDDCDRNRGSCSTGCRYPSYCGPTCTLMCNDGCASQECNQSCECAHGCIPSRWGKWCREFCSLNCNRPQNISLNICDITNGACIHGCVNNSYWGSHCERHCSSNCLSGTCNSISGNCTNGCINSQVYEGNCSLPCSPNCFNLSCARETGYCEHGCKPGWYGKTCKLTCSDHCFNKRCAQRDGTCVSGCQNGWYGPNCTQHCNITCKNRVCSVDTGNCSQGCVPGYQGSHCEKDFPAREQRGPVCFDCHHTGDPHTCDTVTMCTSNQVCSIEKVQLGDSFYYKQGCSSPVCNSPSRRITSVPTCHSCCNDDFCNRNCTSNTIDNGGIVVG